VAPWFVSVRARLISSAGDVFYQKNDGFIFGIPNARMSSYPYFQHFHLVPRLDNFASGIPNAILGPLFGGRNNVPANADPRLRSPETRIERAQAITA
jgi:hypothetical protein